ncbi:hypothetical protein BBP40_000580 [Aspergillus hancockii]|nr:hypothetical protein BBP40_000580 [Aspergillus hancockii]
MGEFRNILRDARATQGRSLVVVHYAGHGVLRQGNILHLVGNQGDGLGFDAMRFLVNLALPVKYDLLVAGPQSEPEDSRDNIRYGRHHPSRKRPAKEHSYYQFSWRDTPSRQRQGHHYVEMADVVQTLRSRPNIVKMPSHGSKMGAQSIRLPFGGMGTMDPSRIPPARRAVLSVGLQEDLTKKQIDNLSQLDPRAP